MRNKVKFVTEAGKERMLSQRGIIYDKTTRNVLRAHNKNEGWGHFLTKAVLYKLFRDKGYDVVLEAETKDGIIDVYVVDLGLAIEVISHPSLGKIHQKKRIYNCFTDILMVDVPEGDLEEFSRAVEKQVHIWV